MAPLFTKPRCKLGLAALILVCNTGSWPARADLSANSALPSYTLDGLVLAATQTSAPLAPNTLATLYGSNLSFTTRAVGPSDLSGGMMPTNLDGVVVYINSSPAPLFFVSPGQINFLVPYDISGVTATLTVNRQNIVGPHLTVPLALTNPAFFVWNGNLAVAEHADGTLITPTAPASAGEVVVFYAAGLGRTSPDSQTGRIISAAAPLYYASQFQISVGGVSCPQSSVLYAGAAPGFAGLYQINLRLPDPLPANPQIRISIGAQTSPPLILLPSR